MRFIFIVKGEKKTGHSITEILAIAPNVKLFYQIPIVTSIVKKKIFDATKSKHEYDLRRRGQVRLSIRFSAQSW